MKKTAVISVVVGSAALGALVWQWGWLSGGDTGNTPNETIRNLGLVVAGVIAFPIAIWRAVVADRQSRVAQEQANSANEQSETAQQGLLYDRYQRGAEMLGDGNLAVRLAGIYALEQLAAEFPEFFHVPVTRLLCAFIRHPTQSDHVNYSFSSPFVMEMREDVTEAVQNIRRRTPSQVEIERRFDFVLDLHESDLRRQMLRNADLSGANLLGANLSGTILSGADLSEAQLAGTIFSDQSIRNARAEEITDQNGNDDDNFLKAEIGGPPSSNFLHKANLSGALFSIYGDMPAQGLLQQHLDLACADPNKPPVLKGVLDTESGRQLVWRGIAV